MLLYVFLFICFIFTLIAVFKNKYGEHLKHFLLSLIIYSILFCIIKLSHYISFMTNGSFNSGTINIFVIISLVSYLIYLFRETMIRWDRLD
jgi:hypothetical protein